MNEINDANFDAIKQAIYDEHKRHCESDSDPVIWIDTSHAWTDGRNIYVNAECQNCMKGSDRTSLRDNKKYHIPPTKSTRRPSTNVAQ